VVGKPLRLKHWLGIISVEGFLGIKMLIKIG